MPTTAEHVTIRLPMEVIEDVQRFVAERADRLHDLLYRNTDDALNADERRELEALVYIGQLGQVLELHAGRPTAASIAAGTAT